MENEPGTKPGTKPGVKPGVKPDARSGGGLVKPQLWLYPTPGGRRPGRPAQSLAARRLLARALRAAGIVVPPGVLALEGLSLRAWLAREHGLGLSISHCPGLVTVALAPRGIGLDCETPGRARDWLAIANQFFTPAEAHVLRCEPAASREAAFLYHWTLKEAAIKLLGGSVFGDLKRLRLQGGGAEVKEAAGRAYWAWAGRWKGAHLALFGAGAAPAAFSACEWSGPDAPGVRDVRGELQGAYLPVVSSGQ